MGVGSTERDDMSKLFATTGNFVHDHLDRLYEYDKNSRTYSHVDQPKSIVNLVRNNGKSYTFKFTDEAIREALEDAYYQYEFMEGASRASAGSFIRSMRKVLSDDFVHPDRAVFVKYLEGY